MVQLYGHVVSSVGDSELTTIEGISENADHPVQKAWLEHDVPQCGYSGQNECAIQ